MAALCVSHKAWCGRFAPQLLIPAVEKLLDHEDSEIIHGLAQHWEMGLE